MDKRASLTMRAQGSPASATSNSRLPPRSGSSPAAPGGGSADAPVPAALAALLHQSDSSGRQVFTSPSPASASPLAPSGVNLAPRVGGAGASPAGDAGGEGAPSGATAPPAAGSEKKPWRLVTAISCCLGFNGNAVSTSAAASSGGVLQAAPGSPSSPAGAAGGSEDTGAGASSVSGGSGGGPPLTPMVLSRRPGVSVYDGAGAPGGAGSDTPSRILSPTNPAAAVRAQRYAAARETYERADITPWGSRHPCVIAAARAAPGSGGGGGGFSSRLLGRSLGIASPPPTERGLTISVSPAVGSHPQATTGLPSPPATPRQRAAAALALSQVSKATEPNAFGQPVERINNVRRAGSSAGDGPLLGHVIPIDRGRHCLVLDLDETLVHSSFKPVPNSDYILPVEIEGVTHQVYVIKRPGCDEFLSRVGKCYEVVIFTASLAKYADPLLDLLDPENVIRARLFREACVFHEGNFVKDLSLVGRDVSGTIIVDNSPASFLFQPENAILCGTFIDDPRDSELWELASFLEAIATVEDVRTPLDQWRANKYTGPESITSPRKPPPREED